MGFTNGNGCSTLTALIVLPVSSRSYAATNAMETIAMIPRILGIIILCNDDFGLKYFNSMMVHLSNELIHISNMPIFLKIPFFVLDCAQIFPTVKAVFADVLIKTVAGNTFANTGLKYSSMCLVLTIIDQIYVCDNFS